MIAINPVAGEPEAPTRRDAQPDPEVPERARHRRYSAAYKLKFLTEYESRDRAGKGALLRPKVCTRRSSRSGASNVIKAR